jgi:hypothetical protein
MATGRVRRERSAVLRAGADAGVTDIFNPSALATFEIVEKLGLPL